MYCTICRQHAIQYVQNNPPDKENDKFLWSYNFHNNVNVRLNKPIMDYQSASTKYIGWNT